MPASAPASAFHEGELAVQIRMGVHDKLAAVGRVAIRDHMPEQHRSFFAQLSFLLAGTVDQHGQPWACALAGPPGFIHSPEPQRLTVQTQPLAATPLATTLRVGERIGLLGIEHHTRRRNRMNGVVSAVTPAGFEVQVQQSFGNCPKYIQPRQALFAPERAAVAQNVLRAPRLDADARQLIQRADTFFIATAYAGDGTPAVHGVDVSHRGGPPGFVQLDDEGILTVPDYVGNFFFNTLGNLTVNPRSGLLFIDFDTGDLLHLAVSVNIIWDGPALAAFAGAQRLLRLQIHEMRRVPAALPLRWEAVNGKSEAP
ncbi:MAG: pyridoxamine 5'-phosphate oxidase-like protein [Comamonadaceae bacterium]|nr:MAG: pyridoxamine 5'-phosphate oxidase-like protein [Comamonadaceae bacterium]